MSLKFLITDEQLEYAKVNSDLDISFKEEQGFIDWKSYKNSRHNTYLGWLSETCFADLLGLPRPEVVDRAKTKIDFVYGGKKIDLKSTDCKNENVRLMVRQDYDTEDLDYFVLCRLSDLFFELLGFVSVKDLHDKGRKESVGYANNFVLWDHELDDIRGLIKIG